MLVETPLNPAVDPEWDLHFAVSLLHLVLMNSPALLVLLSPYYQAPYAQLVLGSAAHALQVALTASFLLFSPTLT